MKAALTNPRDAGKNRQFRGKLRIATGSPAMTLLNKRKALTTAQGE